MKAWVEESLYFFVWQRPERPDQLTSICGYCKYVARSKAARVLGSRKSLYRPGGRIRRLRVASDWYHVPKTRARRLPTDEISGRSKLAVRHHAETDPPDHENPILVGWDNCMDDPKPAETQEAVCLQPA